MEFFSEKLAVNLGIFCFGSVLQAYICIGDVFLVKSQGLPSNIVRFILKLVFGQLTFFGHKA